MLTRLRDIKSDRLVTPEDLNRGHVPQGWYVGRMYKVHRIVYDHLNGCCRSLPILVTTNTVLEGEKLRLNYSAQCACGGWCTTGMWTAQGALDEYDRMTRRG